MTRSRHAVVADQATGAGKAAAAPIASVIVAIGFQPVHTVEFVGDSTAVLLFCDTHDQFNVLYFGIVGRLERVE